MKWAGDVRGPLVIATLPPLIEATPVVVIATALPELEVAATPKLPVPTATIFSNSLHLRISLLATGRYLTLVPGSALRFGPGAGLLKALPVALPRWHLPTAIFTLKGRMLSPVAQVFADCVREVARPLAQGKAQAR